MNTALTARKNGRPTKFTPETIKRILRCVRRGMPLALAANAARVSYSSLCGWRVKHKSFDDAVTMAVAQGVDKNLRVIEQALKSKDEAIRLRAACWFVEHTQPQHFSKSRLEVTGADGEPLSGAQVAVLVWPHEQNRNPQIEIRDAKNNHPAIPSQDAN